MTVKTYPWDPAEYLGDENAVAEYLSAALEEKDPALFTVALGDIARARGISDLARKTKLSRQTLYKALSGQGNPEFATICNVAAALGLRLSVEPATKPAARPHRRKNRKVA
jgi:probable addiction module antidote protein